MEALKKYFSESEILAMTKEQMEDMIYGISQGYDPSNVILKEYIQKTDDCDWAI